MKLIVNNIDWGCGDDRFNHVQTLPRQVVIEDDKLINHLMVDLDGRAENLAEYLTEQYKCPVCGFFAVIDDSGSK